MLSSLKQSSSRLSGRTVLVLACLAIGSLSIPTLKWASEGPFAGLAKLSAGEATIWLVEDKPGANPADVRGPKPAVTDEYFPRPAEAERQILEALEKPVDVDFQGMPLDKCIESLASQAKIDVWIDQVKMSEEGVAMDQPITLKLKGRRLESVLNLILGRLQLTYVYEAEVLKITTSASAADVLITRTYPVGDLCPDFKVVEEKSARKTASTGAVEPTVQLALFQGFGGGGRGGAGGGGRADENPPPKENDAQPKDNHAPPKENGRAQKAPVKFHGITRLMNAISTTVEPDTWEELSGPGCMIPVRETSSLVVRQTWSVHKKILQVLRDLRAAKRLSDAAPPQRAGDAGKPKPQENKGQDL